MSSDGTPGPGDEVSLEELAALRAGELTAEQETRLRARMAHDPEVENKLWALDNVHRLFAKPAPGSDLPPEMPHDVAARLQARIAEHALHTDDPGRGEDSTTSRGRELADDRGEDPSPNAPSNASD